MVWLKAVYLNHQDWRARSNLKNTVTLPVHFKNGGYETRGGGKLYHAASLSQGMHERDLDVQAWDEYFPSKHRQLPKEILPERFPADGSKSFYKGFFNWAALEIEPDEMAGGKVVAWAERQLSVSHGNQDTWPKFLTSRMPTSFF